MEDQNTTQPIFARWEYDTTGTVVGSAFFHPDGTVFAGAVGDLVAPNFTEIDQLLTAVLGVIKQEDLPASNLDALIAAGTVRQDTPSSTTSGTGDYQWLKTTALGGLYTAIDQRMQASDSLGLLKLEDSGHVTGDAGVMALGVMNNAVASLSGSQLDYTPIATNSLGAVQIQVRGEFQEGTSSGFLLKPEDLASVAGDYGVNIHSVRQDAPVNNTSADGDYAAVKSNSVGALYVALVPGTPLTVRANYTTAQTNTSIIGAIAAGTRAVITRCTVAAAHSNTVDVSVVIGFGAATTPTTTGVVFAHPGIAAGSGMVEGAGSGILGQGASDEELRITSSVPTTGSIDVTVTYYTEAI